MDQERKRFWDIAKISLLFLAARLIMVISIPIEGLKSYGDFWNFYNLASLGRPFLDLWVEFPPFFPVLSRGVYLLVGGREHGYIYTLIIIFSIFQAANIYIFQKIAAALHPRQDAFSRTIVYAFFIVGLFYGWAYFDSLAVFCLLLGLYLVMKQDSRVAGLIIGIGGTIKWFPLLVLPAAWKWLGRKKALRVVLVAILVVVFTWGLLVGFSPEFTKASLISQGAKGSWETIWALLDNNLSTGNFNSEINHVVAADASNPSGNPSTIPSWLTLLVIGGIGYIFFWKSSVNSALQLAAFSGLTLILFYLWSPGYSPQWILYLIPLVMLCFESSRSLLLSLVLLLVNLLEWPILLSRGWFHYLEEIILLRTGIFLLLAVLFAQIVMINESEDQVKIDSTQ